MPQGVGTSVAARAVRCSRSFCNDTVSHFPSALGIAICGAGLPTRPPPGVSAQKLTPGWNGGGTQRLNNRVDPARPYISMSLLTF